MHPDCYDSLQNKVNILSTSSVKAPDRKTLGGTDESNSDRSCSLALKDCDRGDDSYELLWGVGGSLKLVVEEDDGCVEPGGKKLISSVIVDQSESCKRSDESPEWREAAKEMDRSAG